MSKTNDTPISPVVLFFGPVFPLSPCLASEPFFPVIRISDISRWVGAISGGLDGKESTCNAGDLGWIPELGRSPGEGNGNKEEPEMMLPH